MRGTGPGCCPIEADGVGSVRCERVCKLWWPCRGVGVPEWILPADGVVLGTLGGSANEAHVAGGSGEPWVGVFCFNGPAVTTWSTKL